MSACAEPLSVTPEGWLARLDLGFEHRGGRTVLAKKEHSGPLTVQRPFYPEGEVCHLYLLHPPGGIVGGDQLEIGLHVAAGAHVLITTPGAAKFYRSAGALATQRQSLRVADSGLLEWLPQENILFPGAIMRAETNIALAGSARFIGWELNSLGRPVIDERFTPGDADLGLSLERNGQPLLKDRMRVQNADDLVGPSGLRGFPIFGAFVAAGATAPDLAAVREALPERMNFPFGLTLVEDLIVARCLARAVEPANRIFRLLWGILRPRLTGHSACPPRIWAT